MSDVCDRDWVLDPASSHSPSAPLIRSKSHYNPTNPTASHHDSLLSGSSALHIRIWNWAGGSSFPPLPSLRELILLSMCLFLITSGKCIRSSTTRAEGHGLGEVGGNSVTGKSLFLLVLGGLFLLLSLLMWYYEKKGGKKQHPSSGAKLLICLQKMWPHATDSRWILVEQAYFKPKSHKLDFLVYTCI